MASGTDKDLIGAFLEVLVRQALAGMGFWITEYPMKPGDRGVDAKAFDPSYDDPLFFVIECMNGRFDYPTTYFPYLQRRIASAWSENHNPVIVCVSKATNFKNFKGTFTCPMEYVELGKQYHPNTTVYADYLVLKGKLKKATDLVALREREEAGERQMREREDKREKEAWEYLDKLSDDEFMERVERWLDKGGSEEDWE